MIHMAPNLSDLHTAVLSSSGFHSVIDSSLTFLNSLLSHYDSDPCTGYDKENLLLYILGGLLRLSITSSEGI
jgi:hypothetical protein